MANLKGFANVPFKNTDSEDFVGEWNSEEFLIAVGETIQVPPFLAKHFAKHLTNKILLRIANKFLEDNAGKDARTLAKEPSWMDERARKPLVCEMLGWTSEKYDEEKEIDEKGPKPMKEETVMKSEVQSMIDKAVAAAVSNLTAPSVPAASSANEFPDAKKLNSIPTKK